ncbi:hypothetical protein GCM10023215_37920 [Pseudonocardia yuanmonensis]|uniref:DUF3040 family protein n=1 Tax=Pseudonocardia yuanmonensis TaxID=1095914 RepID=A0ABP8WYF7_9PSEU
MTLDDRGVRPLTTRERRILAHLERSLTGGGPAPGDPGPDDRAPDDRRTTDRRIDDRRPGDRGLGDRGPGDDGSGDPGTDTVALHRTDRVAAVIGLLVLCGMTAEAAVAGGPVLGIAVGTAFLLMVLTLVRLVRRNHRR